MTHQWWRKLPLRYVLIIPFVLQLFIIVGLVGYLSFKNGQKAVNQMADRLRDESSDRLTQYLDTYLATPLQVNEINLKSYQLKMLNFADYDQTLRYFYQQMLSFPTMGYIDFGSVKGEFIGIERTDQGSLLGYLKGINDKGFYRQYQLDTQGKRVKLTDKIEYEFYEEGWYADAIAAKKPIWSSIYQWEDRPEVLSISASYPVYQDQKIIGVLGVDLILTQISQFLQQLNLSPHSQIFILERNGLLVAKSSNEPIYQMNHHQAQRFHGTNAPNPVISETSRHLLKTFGNFSAIQTSHQLTFKFNGENQWVQVTPWQDQLGLDWLIVITIPESDFMAEIQANLERTIILCILALILSVLIGMKIAQWVTQPILNLNQAAKKIAQGQWEFNHYQNLINRQDELGELAHSFEKMSSQLQDFFQTIQNNQEKLQEAVEDATSKLKQTQVQLIQSEKMSSLGQMVGGIAHEINNPVNFIHGNLQHIQIYYSELLQIIQLYQKHYPETSTEIAEILEDLDLEFIESDFPKLINSMLYGTVRIRNIVNSLKTFSGLDESKIKNINLQEGLDSTLAILDNQIKQAQAKLNLQIIKEYTDLPKIECYPSDLNQALLHIISNALDALEESNLEESFIKIKTEQIEENWVRIMIEDNGQGMTPEIQEKIFDPFFTTKPVGKGTGLGLSIAHTIIVNQHRGRLLCNSTLNQGTIFTIELPLLQN